MNVAIIDYGLGNLGSVRRAFSELGAEVFVAGQPDQLHVATHVVLPGVGAFSDGMAQLNQRGWVDAIRFQVVERGKPFLGICLGMQLLASEGFEGGKTRGLDLIPGKVTRLDQLGCKSRVPHVGWNDISIMNGGARLLDGIGDGTDFYFVHSFAFQPETPAHVVAVCHYDIEVVSVIQNGQVMGTQFHPEKSSRAGFQVLHNFMSIQ
jgi:glutamine amidotransferase